MKVAKGSAFDQGPHAVHEMRLPGQLIDHERKIAEEIGEAPTVGFAVVTFIALLDLYRRAVIDLAQDELFADIVITRREATSAQI